MRGVREGGEGGREGAREGGMSEQEELALLWQGQESKRREDEGH